MQSVNKEEAIVLSSMLRKCRKHREYVDLHQRSFVMIA